MDNETLSIESLDDDWDECGYDDPLGLDEVTERMWKKPSTAAYMVWFRQPWLPFVPITPATPAKPLRWYLERIRRAPKRWVYNLPDEWTSKEELTLARDALYAVSRLPGINKTTRQTLKDVRVALDACYNNEVLLEYLMEKRREVRVAHGRV